ncbi:hypothetical protein Pst134EA_000368 [Puccinia striiformis f. sp. tritici]|uniref:hypothetical protein n=1 Tax=Puccinia striiformis f. sp. tritici TaxID=168172 RepID=UPI002008A4DC|nr:hypothetical protein Pst134EA_000368 [Puccinia striiformis f. sp. tritici]KAH9466532.1 hypothetical protein Pst134EB_001585 [Puccinia striiformis f. sp. tritici]KAH9473295.1 hypothetical protein Pst134EA_000368 [Puccinia striiformis f. sp. tritici]
MLCIELVISIGIDTRLDINISSLESRSTQDVSWATIISTANMSELDDYFDDDIDAAAFDAVVNAATAIPPCRRGSYRLSRIVKG